jgi:hypothetical protein
MPVSIFVSYSHQDVGLVQPVVGLLRATEDLVFHDLDSIKGGRRWRREIEEALYAAQLFVLFWCYHSSQSAEARKEYELALKMGKDVLPVLLDTTPLPKQLSEFQWLDFQQLAGQGHRSYRRCGSQVLSLLKVPLFLSILFSIWIAALTLIPAQFVATVWILIAGTVYMLLAWIMRHQSGKSYYSVTQTRSQRRMAEQIQVELFRRGIGSA